jgi:acetoin utilization protein AcuB
MKKLVRENMSNHLISIGINERVETAFKRMREHSVRHLPVISEVGEIVGMLSDRDVQRAMISTIEHEPRGRGVSETIIFDPETRVRDYMTWPVEAVDQHTGIRLVAERMVQEKISSFLVSHGEKIVGIVTTEDLLRVLMDLLSDSKPESQWTLNNILESSFSQLKSTLV